MIFLTHVVFIVVSIFIMLNLYLFLNKSQKYVNGDLYKDVYPNYKNLKMAITNVNFIFSQKIVYLCFFTWKALLQQTSVFIILIKQHIPCKAVNGSNVRNHSEILTLRLIFYKLSVGSKKPWEMLIIVVN